MGADNSKAEKEEAKNKRRNEFLVKRNYPTYKFTSSDGHEMEIAYQVHGGDECKEKLVWVQGLGGMAHFLEPVIEEFRKTDVGKNFQVLTPENRGIGGSSKPAGKYTTKAMALDILSLLDHLKWTNVHVVGISMGGMISQAIAVNRPEAVKSIAIVSSHAGHWLEATPSFGGFLKLLNQILFPKEGDEAVKQGIHLLCSAKTAKDPSSSKYKTVFANFQRNYNTVGLPAFEHKDHFNSQLAAVNSHKTTEEQFAAIGASKPAIVVRGSEDNIIRIVNSNKMAKAIGCDLKIIPDTGHAVFEESKGEFVEIYCEFLKGQNL
eukprot:m.41178 g.41178  ORF g.41178 m.41178 type:complete len:320 (-) comp9742_c0_seq1:5147-6106(-)